MGSISAGDCLRLRRIIAGADHGDCLAQDGAQGAYPFFGQNRFCRSSRCGWRIGIGKWYVFLHGLEQNGDRHRPWADRYCHFALPDSVDKGLTSMNVRQVIVGKIEKTKVGKRFIREQQFRVIFSASVSLLINILYAFYHGRAK